MREKILSVGIDIGTSTTQLVFSRITIENTASIMSIPRVKIVDKEVIYRSEIYFTPLASETKVDGERVRKIIELEYKKANVSFEEVHTGAVIITGETARKENASEILHTLSGLAGDFVVATAGPDLESIIAGKGAGGEKFSKEKNCAIANLDVGGGTTNIVVFKNGEIIDTASLDIGGRLIKFEDPDFKVSYASNKIKTLAKGIGIDIQIGKRLPKKEVQSICDRMAEILAEGLDILPKTTLLEKMLIGPALKHSYNIDYISFSGGVADCIYKNHDENFLAYGDIGIILGKSIASSSWVKSKKVMKAAETIGATVVGAGSHTTEISGSTITISPNALPLKNIPILRLTQEDESLGLEELSAKIDEKLQWFRLETQQQLVALAIRGIKNPSFQRIQELAKAIIKGTESNLNQNQPIIVVVENDMAKILGQGIRAHLSSKKDVICIDSIKVDNGDYIDIGKPLANGQVVPVIIKTLVFNY